MLKLDPRMTLAQRSGLHTAAREAECLAVLQRLQAAPAVGQVPIHQVRIAWADVHGTWRSKTLVCGNGTGNGTGNSSDTQTDTQAVADALQNGVGMVSTLLLKDTADRTAYKVFEPGALDALPGFGPANNVLLLPDPSSFTLLPWAPGTAWLRADPLWPSGQPVAANPRDALVRALAALAAHPSDHGTGLQLRCGLEVEFHIYRLADPAAGADPQHATWPAEPPAVQLLHPGYCLLSDAYADQTHDALATVRHTALGLGLPLQSLEIELGPSQFEAVFAPTGALQAADHLMLLRNGLRQALRRKGYWCSFVCKPPFDGAVASGWHLHQSLVDAQGRPVMGRQGGLDSAWGAADARRVLSNTGAHWLAGLLAHASGMAALCAPSVSAYSRYQGSVMAPQAAVWGRDNRGAMLRVLGSDGGSDVGSDVGTDTQAPDPTTRIENRLPEPMANPYLVMAAQVWAGLHGLQQQLAPPLARVDAYAPGQPQLPTSLGQALAALAADPVLCQGLGAPQVAVYRAIKQQELARFEEAGALIGNPGSNPGSTQGGAAWQRREYFGRF